MSTCNKYVSGLAKEPKLGLYMRKSLQGVIITSFIFISYRMYLTDFYTNLYAMTEFFLMEVKMYSPRCGWNTCLHPA